MDFKMNFPNSRESQLGYNSLMDPHLASYFNNPRIRKHLRQTGLILPNGEAVTEETYRLYAGKVRRQEQMERLVMEAVTREYHHLNRSRQAAIGQKMDELRKMEIVHRIREEEWKTGASTPGQLLPRRPSSRPPLLVFTPKPKGGARLGARRTTGKPPNEEIRRSSSAPQRGRERRYRKNEDEDESGSSRKSSSTRSSSSSSNDRRRTSSSSSSSSTSSRSSSPSSKSSSFSRSTSSRPSSADHPRSRSVIRVSDEISTRDESTSSQDNFQDDFESMTSSSRSGSTSSRSSLVPHPPPPKDEPRCLSRSNGATAASKNQRRMFKNQFQGQSLKPGRQPRLKHNGCLVTLHFFGVALALHNELADKCSDVLVEQQHCGGNTVTVFRDRVAPGSDFAFYSYRRHGYPFSVTLYVGGRQDSRLSTCCEYKHLAGVRLGGVKGHFGMVGVKDGEPCFRCQLANKSQTDGKEGACGKDGRGSVEREDRKRKEKLDGGKEEEEEGEKRKKSVDKRKHRGERRKAEGEGKLDKSGDKKKKEKEMKIPKGKHEDKQKRRKNEKDEEFEDRGPQKQDEMKEKKLEEGRREQRRNKTHHKKSNSCERESKAEKDDKKTDSRNDLGKDLGNDLGKDLGNDLGKDLGNDLGNDRVNSLSKQKRRNESKQESTSADETSSDETEMESELVGKMVETVLFPGAKGRGNERESEVVEEMMVTALPGVQRSKRVDGGETSERKEGIAYPKMYRSSDESEDAAADVVKNGKNKQRKEQRKNSTGSLIASKGAGGFTLLSTVAVVHSTSAPMKDDDGDRTSSSTRRHSNRRQLTRQRPIGSSDEDEAGGQGEVKVIGTKEGRSDGRAWKDGELAPGDQGPGRDRMERGAAAPKLSLPRMFPGETEEGPMATDKQNEKVVATDGYHSDRRDSGEYENGSGSEHGRHGNHGSHGNHGGHGNKGNQGGHVRRENDGIEVGSGSERGGDKRRSGRESESDNAKGKKKTVSDSESETEKEKAKKSRSDSESDGEKGKNKAMSDNESARKEARGTPRSGSESDRRKDEKTAKSDNRSDRRSVGMASTRSESDRANHRKTETQRSSQTAEKGSLSSAGTGSGYGVDWKAVHSCKAAERDDNSDF